MSRDDESRGEDFASRWSRLKRDTRAPAPGSPETPPAPAGEAQDERSDEEILSELGLPDPETLKPGDDVKAFMASAVPARIRNRVLRKLWVSNPVLANLDRLVDYDDDFTDAAMVPEMLNTAYKVGRGWLEAEDETAAPDAGERADISEAQCDAAPADAPAEAGEDAARPEADPEETADGPAPADDEPAETVTRRAPDAARGARLRRMRFRFADE